MHGCYWIRSVPDDPYSSYEYIEGSENSDQYILTAKDEKRYISFQQGSVGTALNGETTVCCHRAINSIGPVLPGPPRLLDLRIVGSCVKGGRVFAESKYIGGTEGPSEYWWFRIKAGKRIQIGEPKVASDSVTLDDIKTSLSGIEENGCLCDPRVLQLSDEDVGCVLKVKCRPVRIDGYKGEVFTSRPSEVVVESEKLEVLSIAEVDIDDSGKHDKDDGC